MHAKLRTVFAVRNCSFSDHLKLWQRWTKGHMTCTWSCNWCSTPTIMNKIWVLGHLPTLTSNHRYAAMPPPFFSPPHLAPLCLCRLWTCFSTLFGCAFCPVSLPAVLYRKAVGQIGWFSSQRWSPRSPSGRERANAPCSLHIGRPSGAVLRAGTILGAAAILRSQKLPHFQNGAQFQDGTMWPLSRKSMWQIGCFFSKAVYRKVSLLSPKGGRENGVQPREVRSRFKACGDSTGWGSASINNLWIQYSGHTLLWSYVEDYLY